MQIGIAARPHPFGGQEPVAEIGLGRRARADRRAVGREEVELGAVCVCAVDDRRSLRQAARPSEELDRTAAVLGEALLDLLRLLVGVDVQRQFVLAGVPADLLEPVGRARTHGVGGKPDVGSPRRGDSRPGRGSRGPTPAESAAARRVRTRHAGARARSRRLPLPRPRRALRRRRRSGTHRLPCIRQRASRGSRARTPFARAPASDVPPRRASPRARPRSRRPPHDRAWRAGRCGCAR